MAGHLHLSTPSIRLVISSRGLLCFTSLALAQYVPFRGVFQEEVDPQAPGHMCTSTSGHLCYHTSCSPHPFPSAPSSQPRASIYLEHPHCGHIMSAKAVIQNITDQSLNNRNLFLIGLEVQELKSRCLQGWFLVIYFFLDCRRPPFSMSPHGLFSRHMEREERGRDTSPMGLRLHPFNFNNLPLGLFSKCSHIRG